MGISIYEKWCNSEMSKFWELFRESVIIQAFVTLLFSVTLCFLWVNGTDVPGELYALTGIVMGHWFKSKGVNAERQNLATMERIVATKTSQ